MARSTFIKKLISTAYVTSGGLVIFSGFSAYKGDEKFYERCLMPVVHTCFSGESAHRLGILLAKTRLLDFRTEDSTLLKTTVCKLNFDNPIGLAAGFDKDGEAVIGLHKWGFGFVEVGSVTPQPQPGNPKPRVFRLLDDGAVINRYGFNSSGHDEVLKNLNQENFSEIVGVNLGKNKTGDAKTDYSEGLVKFEDVASYFVVNISSPNTPGLRDLQYLSQLQDFLEEIGKVKSKLKRKIPLFLKIAPDLSEVEKQDLAKIILKKEMVVDGLVISNTTISRPQTLKSETKNEIGGLSGKPLTDLSTATISDMYQLTEGKIPIIGVGGVFTGNDAFQKIKAGASLVQVYTVLTYEGPPIVRKIKRELAEILRSEGFSSVQEAVGLNHRK